VHLHWPPDEGPELRQVSSELTVCQLRLAVDGMGRGREVGFIKVSVLGKAGEAAAEYQSRRRTFYALGLRHGSVTKAVA
jgi:hypothetical protein